jgi:hypothetical protein
MVHLLRAPMRADPPARPFRGGLPVDTPGINSFVLRRYTVDELPQEHGDGEDGQDQDRH